ncbi:MAG: Flavoprotein, HI0933 family, partial [Candidatus Yanofskybacteria bacterium GW2011_GWE1_40_10]
IPCVIAKLLYGTSYVINYGYDYEKISKIEKKYVSKGYSDFKNDLVAKGYTYVPFPRAGQDLSTYTVGGQTLSFKSPPEKVTGGSGVPVVKPPTAAQQTAAGFATRLIESDNLLKSFENDVVITLDLFPSEDMGALRQRIQTVLVEQSNKKIKNSLSELIAPALVDTILMLSHIDGETPNHSVRTEDRKILVAILKSVSMSVAGLLGKEKAIVSSGGVALEEVDFKTMQSRLISQLYLVGDVLDVDRPSGGYSLQLCWTTGYVAGSHC